MKSMFEFVVELQTQRWNSLVHKRYRFVRETETALVFCHPTKGFRHISKKRLGL